ncbi:PqqD family protein [Aurantiacibacter rhizosphaerae]|uniref:PqqD family peptide modification chaperone n=1 Tax=Aurantiacibacter rhizosphaerae TaxID=2691582 RepID=A0A844XBS8_9SPHN|nr:PqqD family protein [Aurantiacibacter rhizosphaerae]MWV26965.1 PqqD family peptide modification chaperone [Aurantiacibacter rhizosphaerae]
MTESFTESWSIDQQAVQSKVGDETIILHLESGTYFGLDAIATRIWQGLKEGNTPDLICEELATEFNMNQAVVEADARSFISELIKHGLVSKG